MTENHSSVSPPKLLDQARGKIRLKHYSIRTEQTYVDWIKRFIFFHSKAWLAGETYSFCRRRIGCLKTELDTPYNRAWQREMIGRAPHILMMEAAT